MVAVHSVHQSFENSTNKGELVAWVGLVFWNWIILEGSLASQAAGAPKSFPSFDVLIETLLKTVV